MGNKLILTSALAFALASATAAFAQTNKYDLTGGDHMYSYGPGTPQPSPQAGARQSSRTTVPSRTQTQKLRTAPVSNQTQTTQPRSQFDSTGDHMYSYGPASQ
jgi:hypothetical protein